ncbi:MAG TPA: PAS domain-containing protein [Xanthobacteraceae bacterium]|nr:PAS domain-containing protein [Xanthobacteraceae bacterium]
MTDTPTAFSPSESVEILALAEQIGRIGVIDWQVEAGTVRLSPSARAMYGLTEFDGRYESWIATVHREDQVRLRATIQNALAAKQREFELDFRILRQNDNELRWILARRLVFYDEAGKPVRVVGVSIDVTDQKRATAQLRAFTETLEDAVKDRTRQLEAENEARRKAEELLRQSQKMEAIGQLTGGVAHDFNNMLAVIISGINLLERRLAKGGDVKRLIDGISDAAYRAAGLTHRLLAFSRQLPLAPTAIDANQMVKSISELLRQTLGEATVLETVLAGGLWRTHADAGQLENAILNLAINARDAMPDGGKVTIETLNCSLDDDYVGNYPDLVAGQYVMIAVSDEGSGMSPDTMDRAIDPFFTTKEVGKGTGLGLSQVYGFVKQSKGHLKIYSEIGQGTAVKIYLPRYFGSEQVAEVAAVMRQPERRGASSEVILVVEDEDRIREVTTEALRELGYTALPAASAKQALQILESRPEIGLLFTDIVMPDMNGRRLAEAALKLHPNLKVLYTTGYTRNAVVHNGVLDPDVNFIAKPFTFDQLGQKIREVLS